MVFHSVLVMLMTTILLALRCIELDKYKWLNARFPSLVKWDNNKEDIKQVSTT